MAMALHAAKLPFRRPQRRRAPPQLLIAPAPPQKALTRKPPDQMPDKDRIKQLLGELQLRLHLPFPQKAYQCSSGRCPALSVLTLLAGNPANSCRLHGTQSGEV
jgi:hypothetical protein